MKRPARRRVALLVESSRAYGRGVLQGVSQYVREHQHWSVLWEEWKWTDAPPTWLADWNGDGIIARVETAALAKVIERLGIPCIDVRGSVRGFSAPLIDTDDRAVSALAAEHLLERGFRQAAFCGFVGANYSDTRCEWFRECLSRAGVACHVYAPPQPPPHCGTIALERHGLLLEHDVMRWLAALPKPVGIMACNDIRGQQVINACGRLGLLVPDEVAVVGVDNDEVVCELSDPPLTSVAPHTRRIGYEAATLLEKLMAGSKALPGPRLISPLGIVNRRSTDVLAIPDRAIAAVLRFVREHACEGIQVSDLVRVAALSRSVFERRFTHLVGHSPKAEVLRVRLARAKQLLTDTDLGLTAVAERCGFKHPEYFATLFRLKVGTTPGQFRRQAQVQPAPERPPGRA